MRLPAKTKFGNRKVLLDGHVFDSVKEMNRYRELKLLLNAGKIHHLELQPVFKLFCGQRPIVFPSGRQAYYQADFSYFDYDRPEKQRVVEDVKGFKTKEYKLKKAIVEACYPGVKIEEV